jgi:hypothetical protein
MNSVLVAAQRCTRGRAKSSGVELRIAQTRIGGAIQRRCRVDTTKGARDAITLVIGHDEQQVGRAFGRHNARRPPGLGIQGALLDHSAKLRRRRRKLGEPNSPGTGCATTGVTASTAATRNAAASATTPISLGSIFMLFLLMLGPLRRHWVRALFIENASRNEPHRGGLESTGRVGCWELVEGVVGHRKH